MHVCTVCCRCLHTYLHICVYFVSVSPVMSPAVSPAVSPGGHLAVSPGCVTWLRHLAVSPGCVLSCSVTFYSESQIMRWRERLLEVLGAVRRVRDSFAFVHRAEVVDKEVPRQREGGREEDEGRQWTHNRLAEQHKPGAVQLKVVVRMFVLHGYLMLCVCVCVCVCVRACVRVCVFVTGLSHESHICHT